MAKLDKSQQQYALNRIDQIKNDAIRKLGTVKEDVDSDKLVEALQKKGFEVVNSWKIANYIKLPATASHLKAVKVHEAKIAAIRSAADSAKDLVMLGDSEQVTKILADFAKKLGV